MAGYYEGFRYDITSLGPYAGGDTRLVPKAGTLDLYRKGATIAGTSSGGPGNVVLAVYDPGTIVPGDTVKVGTKAVTGTVQAASYTNNTLTVNWSGATNWDTGERLIVTTARPVGYGDPYFVGTPLGSTVSFGSTTGLASFYTRASEIDIIRTVGGASDVLVDQAGIGGKFVQNPTDFGLAGDGASDDGPALARLLLYGKMKGRGVIELPPGDIRIDSAVPIDGFSGFVLRGQGPGVTRLLTAVNGLYMFQLSNCADVIFEDMTVGHTGAGASVSTIEIGATCSRTRFRRVNFLNAGIVSDSGTDTSFEDVYLEGAGWSGGIYFLNSTRPKVRGIVSRIAASPAEAILHFEGATGAQLAGLDIVPADLSLYAAPAIEVEGAATEVLIVSGRLAGGDKATGSQPAVKMSNGTLAMTNVTMEDSRVGAAVTGAQALSLSSCLVAGVREHGIEVTGDYEILQVSDHRSSDIAQAATGDHLYIQPTSAPAISTKVNGLIFGNFARGGASTARYVVNAGQYAEPPELTGIDGDQSTLATGLYNLHSSLAGTKAVAHNTVASTETRAHDAFTLPVISTTSTTPTVSKYGVVRMTSAVTVTNFLQPTNGQTIVVLNASGGTLVIDNNASIITASGSDISLAVGAGATFTYDGTSGVWREV